MAWKAIGKPKSSPKKEICCSMYFSRFACPYIFKVPFLPSMPSVDSSPGKPRMWSPCRCDIKMWFSLARDRSSCLITFCVPSPQSISIYLLCIPNIWELWFASFDGIAEPLPSMVSFNLSGITSLFSIKLQKNAFFSRFWAALLKYCSSLVLIITNF